MAAALLGVVLDGAAPAELLEPAAFSSAGLLEGGRSVTAHTLTVMDSFGVDLSGHRSTQLTTKAIEEADLILGMERRHGREVVLRHPSAFGRTFTLKDLVRRGEELGPRRPGQPVGLWLDALGQGRARSDLVGLSAEDEVADPVGGNLAAHRATATELSDLVQRMAKFLWPAAMGVPIQT
jgi:protein-tyrosine phosphatase